MIEPYELIRRIKAIEELDKPKSIRGVPEPQRTPQPPHYKLMPDGHTLYGPEPATPPCPGEEAPRTVKGNYPRLILPREKPKGSSANLVGETPYDRERGTPHTMGGSVDFIAYLLVIVVLQLLVILILLSVGG